MSDQLIDTVSEVLKLKGAELEKKWQQGGGALTGRRFKVFAIAGARCALF